MIKLIKGKNLLEENTDATYNKRILLGHIVDNVPIYLYQRTYITPNCNDTYWNNNIQVYIN